MIREVDYLISLCRAFLNSKQLAADGSINYETLYKIANSHNISAVVFAVMNTSEGRELIPEKSFKSFENDFFEAVMRYKLQSDAIDELDLQLSKNEIPHIFFKGSVLKELYPVPEARVMGDIDVLIKPEYRDAVRKVLTADGYLCEKHNGPVYNYLKDGVLTEMHTKIISGKVGSADAEEYFEDAAENAVYEGFSGTLDTDYHFAYLIAHIAHHFWFYGAGIKLILDLAVMLKNCSVNIENVLAIMEDAGLADFAKVILSVCYEWFEIGESFGADTESTKEFLLRYGAFGNANRNLSAVAERKQLEEGETSPFKMKLRLLFPSYEKMKNIDYMKFIEGKPHLTPAGWIYRAGYNLKNKRKFVKSSVKAIGSDETKGEAEKELAYFKEIGLL